MKSLFLLAALVSCKTVAVLINTSKNFFNYRHFVNTQVFYQGLVKMGLSSDNILSLAPERIESDPRNIFPDRMYINETDYISPQSYRICNLTDQYILNLLYMRHPFLYDLDENDNTLFYLTGHGCEEFLKVSDRYFIFTQDLMDAIQYLSKRLNKVGIVLDTCQASSLVYEDQIPSNVFVITTSLKGQFSYSSKSNSTLGVFTIDEFVDAFFNSSMDLSCSLEDIVKNLNNNKVTSTISLYGNTNISIKDFLFEFGDGQVKQFII